MPVLRVFCLLLMLSAGLAAQPLRYATYFGGTQYIDSPRAASSPDGTIVVAGLGSGFDFPTTDATLMQPSSSPQMFVSKIDPRKRGREGLVFSSFIGGGSETRISAVEVAPNGWVYLAGSTQRDDMPATEGAFQGDPGVELVSPEREVFFAVVDPSRKGAEALVYVTYLGGEYQESVIGMSLDAEGRAVLWGTTESHQFPTTPGAYPVAPAERSQTRRWIARFQPRASGVASLEYSSFLPLAYLEAIEVDSQGRFHLASPYAGSTASLPPTTAGAFRPECLVMQSVGFCGEGYYAVLDPSVAGAAALRYGTFLGSMSGPISLVLDAESMPWIAALTTDVNFDATNRELGASCPGQPPDCTRLRDADIALLRLNPSAQGAGSRLWSARLGGGDREESVRAVAAPNGGIYLTGETESEDFPVTSPAIGSLCPTDGRFCSYGNLFFAHVDDERSGREALRFGLRIGGEGLDYLPFPWALVLTSSGQPVLNGLTQSRDFPTTPGAPDTESHAPTTDFQRAFMTRLDPLAEPARRLAFSTFWEESPEAVLPTAEGLLLAVSQTTDPESPTTVGAFDRTCGFGQGLPRESCSRNLYIALFDPNDGPPVSLENEEPVHVDYSIPDPVPTLDGRRVEAAAALTLRAFGESEDRWLTAESERVSGEVRPVLAPGALGVGEYAGRLRIVSEDPVIRRDLAINLTIDSPPPSAIAAVLNAASFEDRPIAPGEIVSLFGTGFGPALGAGTRSDGTQLAREVEGVSVYVNELNAPVLFASYGQVNLIVPYEVAGLRTLNFRVYTPRGASPGFGASGAATAPALFTLNGLGSGLAAALNQDGSLNAAANPARRGDIVTVFGTGEGVTSPAGATGALVKELLEVRANVTATIGGAAAEVLFAGPAPGFAGLLQVNLRVPVAAQSGAASIELRIGDARSQTGVTVAIE